MVLAVREHDLFQDLASPILFSFQFGYLIDNFMPVFFCVKVSHCDLFPS